MKVSSNVIYVAHAYTDLPPEEQRLAVQRTSAYANHLIECGHIVFSPLSMFTTIDNACKPNKITHTSWMMNCLWWLLRCGCVHLIQHPANEHSTGIAIECAIAHRHNIPVQEVNVDIILEGDDDDPFAETRPAD